MTMATRAIWPKQETGEREYTKQGGSSRCNLGVHEARLLVLIQLLDTDGGTAHRSQQCYSEVRTTPPTAVQHTGGRELGCLV